MIPGKPIYDRTFNPHVEADRYRRVDALVARGTCRCHECGRGTANHSITICRGCEVKISRELEAIGWGDWLNGGPAPVPSPEQ